MSVDKRGVIFLKRKFPNNLLIGHHGDSRMVEHSTHDAKFSGSNPANPGTSGEFVEHTSPT